MKSPRSAKLRALAQPSVVVPTLALIFVLIGALFSNAVRLPSLSLVPLVTPLLRSSSTKDNFSQAWRSSPETCDDWLAAQKSADSYVDVYVIGSQKGATSQLSRHFHKLGVRRQGMKKEWHFFNKVDENSELIKRSVANPLPELSPKVLRPMHYKTGFPDFDNVSSTVPPLDYSPVENRTLVVDSTVEYLHSDRSAVLAAALTPHAKVVVTVRDPLDRALSQYNMVIRVTNGQLREAGEPDRPATAEGFHQVVSDEIAALKRCGYDAVNASFAGKTSELLGCIFDTQGQPEMKMLSITRGLYHLHISSWRAHFPDNHIQVVSFNDVMLGLPQVYHDLSEFLCMRPWPQEMLDSYAQNATTMSFGQMAAKGKDDMGLDSYDGNNKYLAEMKPETREMLRDFYRPADKKLEALLGRKMYEY